MKGGHQNDNFNVFVNVAYDVTQTSEIATDDDAISPQTFDVDGGNRVIYGEWLKEDRYDDPQIPLSYVYYEPEMDADEKILGCIAGDDTIMCACKSSELAEGVMEKLGSILNRR